LPGQCYTSITAYGPPKDLSAKENFAKEVCVVSPMCLLKGGGELKSFPPPRCSQLELVWN
jgi:hypothetical protein